MKYILMRFYGGGGLARYKIIKCKEEDLIDYLKQFEEDCVISNEGEYNGIIDEKELKNIIKGA